MFRIFSTILILLLAFTTLAVIPAQAMPDAGVVGNGTAGSCTETALNTALAGGGNVTFNCGAANVTITVTSAKSINQDTTIDGGSKITISGGLTTFLFHVFTPASLTLKNITLDKGFNANGDGGAIVASGPVILNNTIIQNSQAPVTNCGGAIWTNGTLTTTASTFLSNAAGNGGALCTGMTGSPKLNLTNTNFANNRAAGTTASTGFGGAIMVQSPGQLTVVNGSISAGSAQLGGGVFVASGATASITGVNGQVVMNANTVSDSGGAIYNDGGTLTVKTVNFINNQSPQNSPLFGYGGAIANLGAMTLTDSYVGGNGGRYGGGVFVGGKANASATIARVIFDVNSAGLLGGGLYTNSETTTINVTDSDFHDNTTAGSGGGFARFSAKLTVTDSSATHNTAAQGGGAMISAGPQVTSGGYVEIKDTTFSDNTATSGQGGGVYNSGALLDMGGVTITNNTNGIFSPASTGAVTRIYDVVLQNGVTANCDGGGQGAVLALSSAGGNFSTDATCALKGFQDQEGGTLNPMLGNLTKDTNGFTFYRMPQAGSPLIGTAVPHCLDTDQRHVARGSSCDIGAVEYVSGVINHTGNTNVFMPFVTK